MQWHCLQILKQSRDAFTFPLTIKALNGGDFKWGCAPRSIMHTSGLQQASQSIAHLPLAHVRLEPVQCKATGAGTVKLHWKTVGNFVRVTRRKYLLEYVLIVQRGWKGLFLLCPLIPSPKCIISRIECTNDLLTLFGILKAPSPICHELFGIESALIPFRLQKS